MKGQAYLSVRTNCALPFMEPSDLSIYRDRATNTARGTALLATTECSTSKAAIAGPA